MGIFEARSLARSNDRFFADQIKVDRDKVKLGLFRLSLFIATSFILMLVGTTLFVGLQLLTEATYLLQLSGLLLIGTVVYAFFPRFEAPPPDELCVDQAAFPAIFEMVQQVAQRYGLKPPRIVITEQHRIGFGRFGWRAEPVLLLSHGLLSLVNRQEATVLLLHELHHHKYSSWARSRIISSTLNGLGRLLLARQHVTPLLHAYRLLLLPITILFWLLKWLSSLELRQLEFAADAASVSYSHTGVMQSLLQKCAFRYISRVQNSYLSAKPEHKYAALQAAVANVSSAQLEAIWADIYNAPSSPFDNHPTIKERLTIANKVVDQGHKLLISSQQFDAAQGELTRWPIWFDETEQRLTREGML